MISVVIPTYNRLDKLKKTLELFGGQTLDRKDFEVIVADDGSSDGTQYFMKKFAESAGFNLRYFLLAHLGPGQARNFGADKAFGEIVFFCGDDTFPDKNLLKFHHEHHQRKKNIAVLGITLWDENEKISDFMRWISPAGPQFHYNTIKNKSSAGFDHFYTSNISLEKKWLEKEKFDSRFEQAAFEDIDLGLRLGRKGLKIVFEKNAKVFHSHFYDAESFGQRMKKVGQVAAVFFDKYKNDKKISRMLKRKYAPFCFFPGLKIFNQISFILAKLSLLKKINIKYHWFWMVCHYYSSGLLEGIKKGKN